MRMEQKHLSSFVKKFADLKSQISQALTVCTSWLKAIRFVNDKN